MNHESITLSRSSAVEYRSPASRRMVLGAPVTGFITAFCQLGWTSLIRRDGAIIDVLWLP